MLQTEAALLLPRGIYARKNSCSKKLRCEKVNKLISLAACTPSGGGSNCRNREGAS